MLNGARVYFLSDEQWEQGLPNPRSRPNPDGYALVAEMGSPPANPIQACEFLYRELQNVMHPWVVSANARIAVREREQTKRSMAICDVVVLPTGTYYCDMIGFKKVVNQEDWAEK